MSNYDIAFARLIKYEGGYVHDPDDRGGETYKGIARNFHPGWNGWKLIDALKSAEDFPKNLDKVQILQDAVKSFYKSKFWDKVYGDELPASIAEELFEQSVNMGLSSATKNLQIALNLLNRNGRLYADIVADGVFGKITLATFRISYAANGERLIFNVLNILQGAYYIELMLNNRVYEKYIGWFERVEIVRRG